MTNYPAWVNEPTDQDLEDYFGGPTLQRGRAYAQESRVGGIIAADKVIAARVRGSGYSTYRTSVVHNPAAGTIHTMCSCPVHDACKHGAAVLVHARTVQTQLQVPNWRRMLDPVVATNRDDDQGAALALQLSDDGYGPHLMPLRWGASYRWVKSGAGWHELRYKEREIHPDHFDAVTALREAFPRPSYEYSGGGSGLPLKEFDATLWHLLRRARDVGVQLLPGEGARRSRMPTPLLLDEPAHAFLEVGGADHGLSITPSIRIDGEVQPHVAITLLGRRAHGVALRTHDAYILAPLDRPMTQHEQRLFTQDPVRVPASDSALFAAAYFPQLKERFDVELAPGVVLPEPEPPVLRCDVTFDGHSASLHWGYRYTMGKQVHDLGLRPSGTEPMVRNPSAEAALAASVPEGQWLGADVAGRARLHNLVLTGRAFLHFTSEVLPVLQGRDDVVVTLNEEAPDLNEALEAPEISLNLEDSREGDWFDLEVGITVAGEKVPFAPLLAALAAGDDHLILDSGTWFSLDVPELDRLRALVEEARLLVDHEGNTFQLRPEHAGLWQELVELGVIAGQSTAWQDAVGALLDHTELADVEPPAGLQATLRPYQREGYAWLSFLWRTRLGGILADEMGLGKTLQSLAMAQAALEAGELESPMLVVAPTSVIGTWASEAARFTPDLRVVAITETGRRRGAPLAEVVAGAHVVLTSYTLLRLEADHYLEHTWSGVLLDEAQFVKNPASKVYQAVRKLRARVKVALTGTPLENNLMDLWSLLSITAPGLYPDPKVFTDAYRKPIEAGDSDALARLHRRTRPLMLRRTKQAVATELPDKQEQVVSVPLTPAHRKLYDRHLTRERQKVLGLVGELNRNRITILRSLTLLRQLSLAPSLVDADYPAQSAKIDALMEHLEELIAAGHRALVFSQFTGFLALVKDRLTQEGIAFEYLDGRTRNRAERIDAFREGDAPVFLISLKAGGFGLTLTEADYVFILDPWWNPATESQAIDRTHRIGQDKPVNVYRLVSTDTIEEKVVALQERKRDLFDAVVGSASDISAPLSADDIRALLDVDDEAAAAG